MINIISHMPVFKRASLCAMLFVALPSCSNTGTTARFQRPHGLAINNAGGLYVADTFNSTIREITPDGVVTTVAGKAEAEGATDGPGTSARFNRPYGIATDRAGNIYVADNANTIRKIAPSHAVTTLAGSPGQAGAVDGIGSDARFDGLTGIAVDGAGNVYVAEFSSHTIRKVAQSGVVSTFAGKVGEQGAVDGVGREARFFRPRGLATDSKGNVYVADTGNNLLRKITPAGMVTTLAGDPEEGERQACWKECPDYRVDGKGIKASFDAIKAIASDADDNLYVADNIAIRKIAPDGTVSTLAVSPKAIPDGDGVGSEAWEWYPTGIAADDAGNVYFTEYGAVRKLSKFGSISIWAGADGGVGSEDSH